MANAGKDMVVRVAASSAGPFTAVADLKEASLSQSGNNQDVSTFGTEWIRRIQGLKDASYSLSGFYAPGDADGQVAIRDAWLAGTPLFVQFLPDGSTGFQQEVRVSTYEVSAAADATQDVSIELEGTGPITAV
jgi:predicted secreted protein